ncbi:MAG: hypothetical protein IJ852_05920 [Alphaproteobacteria bacterium]|nr:hypothetical protein [Alphaproteobacteria bacterium]
MKRKLCYLCCGLIYATSVQAEPILLKNNTGNLSLSIYNQNLALVKDTRSAELKNGANEIIFDGVAQQIQPETALIYGNDIVVDEQNYNYNLISYDNMIKQNIGREVTTVRENPTTGENIYERAVINGYANGQLILRFPYGIDTQFPGRIVFNEIPADLSNKPTLAAKINAGKGGFQNLNLAYLTDGVSWKTDYVANVMAPDRLDLTGWVTITNESGIDYEKAKIQLIAGDVNIVRQNIRPQMATMKLMAFSADMAERNAAGIAAPQSLNSYELYTLPKITSIKDKQTKQIALLERKNVLYKKEYEATSPFHFYNEMEKDEFEKIHPQITYVMNNTAKSNLGISLPSGTVRFYQNDKTGNLQFIGAANIDHTAKEDTLRLALGDAFNISLSGKILHIKTEELSKNPLPNNCQNVKVKKTFDVEMTVNNAEPNDNVVALTQYLPKDFTLVKENMSGEMKNATTRVWNIKAPKSSKATLTYTISTTYKQNKCD